MTQKGFAAVLTFSFLTEHLISKPAEWSAKSRPIRCWDLHATWKFTHSRYMPDLSLNFIFVHNFDISFNPTVPMPLGIYQKCKTNLLCTDSCPMSFWNPLQLVHPILRIDCKKLLFSYQTRKVGSERVRLII